MRITDLALVDFRSHHDLVLRLEPGVTALVGPNGMGKTNIVEAIGYLASLRSHRVAADLPLVRQGAPRALIRAKVVRAERAIQVSLEIKPTGANRAWLGRNQVKRLSDVLGSVQAVIFAPEDLALVRGGPEGRRDFMDQLLVLRRPALLGPIRDYDKVLRQRGALLKSVGHLSAAARPAALDTLTVWNDKAAELGAVITAERAALTRELSQHLAAIYPTFGPAGEQVSAEYQPVTGLADLADLADSPGTAGQAAIRQVLSQQMAQLLPKEIDRGVNLVGPHRDELVLTIHGRPARAYASHGEAWSLALALRLSSFELLKAMGQGDPILILDDVFAELDTARRDRLVTIALAAEQVWVTAAVAHDLPEALSGERYRVDAEGVSREG